MESISFRSFSEPQDKVGARDWLALATGLNVAFTACYLTIKPPEPHSSTLLERMFISVVSVSMACLIGWLGTRIALPHQSGRYFGDFAQTGFRGWVFLPSISLFLQHESLWAQIIAGASAMLMADYISRFIEALSRSTKDFSRNQPHSNQAMFMTDALIAPRSPIPFYVSVSLFGVLAAIAAQWAFLEIFFLSLAIFLTVLQIKSMQSQVPYNKTEVRSQSSVLVAVALCLTFTALAPFINSFAATFTGWSRPRLQIGTGKQKASAMIFHTIVLWPKKNEEKIERTYVARAVRISPGRARVWSIPFTGPYWYMKVAGEVPDTDARVTEGDPLKVNVRSGDRRPLVMEAHQHLSEPVDLACCRELQVVIRNDASLGATAIGLTLADSQANHSEDWGSKVILADNSDLAHSALATSERTISFSVPEHGTIERFDEITVTLKSDEKRLTFGRKVAVERFVLVPR